MRRRQRSSGGEEQAVISTLLQVSAGGGYGFEKFEVVFPGEGSIGKKKVQSLPETSDSSVLILEGVNEPQLVVKHAGVD